jgi:hypothetical protein
LYLSFVLSNSDEESLIEHPEKPNIQFLFEKPLINLGGFFVLGRSQRPDLGWRPKPLTENELRHEAATKFPVAAEARCRGSHVKP